VTGVVLATGDGRERRLTPADFPLALEAGPGAAEPAGWLGMEGGELFVQPALPAGTEILCNGSPVMASQWLRAGDVVRYGDAVLRLEAAGSGLTLRFEMGGTRPGRSLVQEIAPLPAAGINMMPPGGEPQQIVRPAAYVPRAQRRPARRRRRLRPAAILPWILLVVLAMAAWLVFTMRSVEIRVEPAPDRMSLTGSPLTWALGGRHMLRPGTYRLTAEKAGHARLDEALEVTDDPYQSFVFTLEKLPGRVVVDAGDVQGAIVSLDGEPVGITPLAELELAAGSYRLEVRAERYREFVTDLTVRGGGETETIQAVLQPLWSPVTFRSSPAGAKLKIDGEGVGRTPVTRELLAGTHIYEISLAGHRPFRASVEVAPETPLEVPVVDLAAVDGRLRIVTEPAGATVSVDGQVRGTSPLEVAVSPGVPHEVAASVAGHDGARRSAQVAADTRQEVALTLPPRLGTIVFAAEPGDADLIVDGTPRGHASQSLALPAIPHDIEIRKAGHETYSTTITPRPEFEQSVRVALKTVAQVQAEKTPPVITTSQGQKMILVPPGKFTMGAPRREPGRRSNETLREIAITRPYYLAATEVSNTQFREFDPEHLSGASGDVNLEIDTHPVVRVTWLEACNWLSGKEGLPPVYDITGGVVRARRPFGPGYRLPTEAEWVWAARYAGGQGKQKYPWGDSLPPVAGSDNYADDTAAGTLSATLPGFSDGFAGTAPVEQFPANALGLHSLGGNVAEWMHDLYAIYPPSSTPEQDPVGGDEGELHVIRGGSWIEAVISELRLSYREYGVEARPDLGFRIARSPE